MANRVVSTELWNDKKWVGIENIRTRYVWLYLLTCPFTQSCGVFKLPLQYASVDTRLDIDELKRSIRELQDLRLCIYDSGTSEIAILRYPLYNVRHINDSLLYMLSNGLKMTKNHNLVKAVYLTLCKSNRNDLQPLLDLYDSFLKGKESPLGKSIKEKTFKEKGLRDKVKGQGLGYGKEKENNFSQIIKENDNGDLDDATWQELIAEVDTK